MDVLLHWNNEIHEVKYNQKRHDSTLVVAKKQPALCNNIEDG